MTETDDQWDRLECHRRRAAQYSLKILVWGPRDDGSPEYTARVALRDALRKNGHDARFSEDLIGHPDALANPLDDETLQADVADVIVVIYRSRGTQSECDMILVNAAIASKTILFVEKQLDTTLETKAIVHESWREMKRRAKMAFTYEAGSLPSAIINPAIEKTEEIRRACYVRDLRLGGTP